MCGVHFYEIFKGISGVGYFFSKNDLKSTVGLVNFLKILDFIENT